MIPAAAMAFAELPERRPTGRSRRDGCHAPRTRKLSPEQEAALRRSAPGRSLRDLAAEFRVSHETVRAVLRERECRLGGAAA